jgi:hypothetical protein
MIETTLISAFHIAKWVAVGQIIVVGMEKMRKSAKETKITKHKKWSDIR